MCSKDYRQNESKKSKIQYFSQEAVKNTYWAIRPTVAITSLSKMVARHSKWPCQKAHLLYSRKRKHINGEKIKLTFFQSATWSIFFQSADWTTLIAIRCCCMLSFLNPLLQLLGSRLMDKLSCIPVFFIMQVTKSCLQSIQKKSKQSQKYLISTEVFQELLRNLNFCKSLW